MLLELRDQHYTFDPFLAPQPVGGKQPACPPVGLRKTLPGPGLWAAEANLVYVPVGIIAAGFATEEPEEGRVAAGLYGAQTLRRDAPALVLWAYVFGTQPGDTLSLGFSGPNGDPSVQQTLGFRAPTARAMRFVGDRLGAGLSWPVGSYRGQVTLKRGTDAALAVSRSLLVQ